MSDSEQREFRFERCRLSVHNVGQSYPRPPRFSSQSRHQIWGFFNAPSRRPCRTPVSGLEGSGQIAWILRINLADLSDFVLGRAIGTVRLAECRLYCRDAALAFSSARFSQKLCLHTRHSRRIPPSVSCVRKWIAFPRLSQHTGQNGISSPS